MALALFLLIAAPEDACEPPWEVLESCPLFGNEDAVEANHSHRAAQLEAVIDGDYCIDVVYSSGWESDPEPVGFADFELVDTYVDPECQPSALVEVAPVEHTTCAPGRYSMHIDDSLGDEGQVLAILDGLVLLELDGELRYLLAAHAEAPMCWRMIWHPPWKLAPPRRASTPQRPNPRRRNRRR